MANYETDVLVRMRADSREVDDAFDRTQGSAITTGSVIEATMIAALVKFGMEASNIAMQFEQEMATVQAISGATALELQVLEDSAREMGATTEWSATQSAEAMQYLALAGMEVNEITEAMPAVLNLATAAQLDLATAADMATDTMTMFGYSSEELNEVMDIFVAAQQNANLSVTQLFGSLQMVGPAAVAAGVSLEETAAATMVLADAGVKGTSAGTALNAMFTDMKNKVDGTTLSFGEFNVEMYDMDGAFRGLLPIMEDIEEATAGMDQATKDASLGNVFQVRSLRAVNIILEQGTDTMADYIDELENSSGASEEAAEIMRDTTANSVKTLESAFQELMITVGSLINAFLEPLIKTLTILITALNSIPAPLMDVIITLGLFATVIGSVTTALRLMGVSGAKIPKVFGPVGLTIMAVGVSVMLLTKEIKRLNTVIEDDFTGAAETMRNASATTAESVTDLTGALNDERNALLNLIDAQEEVIETLEELGLETENAELILEGYVGDLDELILTIIDAFAPGGDVRAAIAGMGGVFSDEMQVMMDELEFFATEGPLEFREFAQNSIEELETMTSDALEILDGQILIFQEAGDEILKNNGDTWDDMSEDSIQSLTSLILAQEGVIRGSLETFQVNNDKWLEMNQSKLDEETEQASNADLRRIGRQKTNYDTMTGQDQAYYDAKIAQQQGHATREQEEEIFAYESRGKHQEGFNEKQFEAYKVQQEKLALARENSFLAELEDIGLMNEQVLLLTSEHYSKLSDEEKEAFDEKLVKLGEMNEEEQLVYVEQFEKLLLNAEKGGADIGDAQIEAQKEHFWSGWWPFKKDVTDEQDSLNADSEAAYSGGTSYSAGAGASNSGQSQSYNQAFSQSSNPSIGGMGSGVGGVSSYASNGGGGGSTSNSNTSNQNTSNRTINVYPNNWDKPTQKRMEDEQKLQDWNNL